MREYLIDSAGNPKSAKIDTIPIRTHIIRKRVFHSLPMRSHVSEKIVEVF